MDSNGEDIPSITVTGEAVLVRKPDVAYVNLFIRTDGTLLQDALRENAATADQVRQALLDAYPEIRDIEIQDVFMGEGRHATGLVGDKATIARPEVIRSFLVTIPPDQVLGIAIADRAIRLGCLMKNPIVFIGISPQSTIAFGLVEPATAKDDALKEALDNAKDKAQRIAGFMGKNIGAIEQVSVLETPGSFEMMRQSRHAAWSRIKSYVSNSADGIEVPAKISVTFKLAD